MGRTFLDIDMARAADLLGHRERRQAETFRDLARGQFVALGPALTRRPITVRRRRGRDAAALQRLEADAVAAEPAAARAISCWRRSPSSWCGHVERTPRGTAGGAGLYARASGDDRPRGAVGRRWPSRTAGRRPRSARRAAFLSIARAVMAEAGAAFRAEAALYQDFVRCRIARLAAAAGADGVPLPAQSARGSAARAEGRNGSERSRSRATCPRRRSYLPADRGGGGRLAPLPVRRTNSRCVPAPFGRTGAEAARAIFEKSGHVVMRQDIRRQPRRRACRSRHRERRRATPAAYCSGGAVAAK